MIALRQDHASRYTSFHKYAFGVQCHSNHSNSMTLRIDLKRTRHSNRPKRQKAFVHMGIQSVNTIISPLQCLFYIQTYDTADCKRAYRESSTPYEARKTCMIDVHGAFAQVSQVFRFRDTSHLLLNHPFYILYR